MENSKSKIELNNGHMIPRIGLGTYRLLEGGEVEQAIKWALEDGCRLFDTASMYKNEEAIGKTLKDYGLLREGYFVSTKVWNEDEGYENTLKAFELSMKKLDISYIDLYLIHWPSASSDRNETIDKREETWKALEEIYASGKVKAIGVSNYTVEHLKEMKSYANIMPAVNQIEFHPFLYQKGLLEYCKENNIVVMGYSPLTKGHKVDDERILKIASKYNKTPAQVMIRWSIEHGVIPIPKSGRQNRIKENMDVFDFELSKEDMDSLNSLSENLHVAWDPSLIS